MNKIYFIDEAYLKSNTTINLNVDTNLIKNAILEAQFMYIQDVLGTKLYKKIESIIEAGAINDALNVNYKTLLDDHIRRATSMWALYRSITAIRYKIMNKGVMSQNSDNSTPTELTEVRFMMDDARNSAEFLSKRMSDYLCANMSLFPEYKSTTYDEMAPNTDQYFSGLVLDSYYEDRFIGYNKNIINL